MALQALKDFTAHSNVMVFAQPTDGVGFVPLLLSQASIASPTRAQLSLSETENVQRRWSMTRNPLERVVAQNRLREPTTLTVTGMMSADPVFSPLALLGIARLDRIELRKLITILERSTAFVVTPERAYPNMGCKVLDEMYDDTTGRGVMLTMQFEEFLIARPGLVEGEFDLDAMGAGALAATDMGATTPGVL